VIRLSSGEHLASLIKARMSITWEEEQRQKIETLRFSADPAINKKVKAALEGIKRPCDQKVFLDFPSDRDKELVADFLISSIKQENAPPNTRRLYLIALARLYDSVRGLSDVKKSLDDITAKELTEYLNKIQRKREEDPDQSWISTYKAYAFPLMKFFKWRKYPDLTPRERRKLPKDQQPAVLKGLVIHSKTGSKSPIKAKDIWNDEDTAVFLKYCKDNRRLRFYHALAIETSGRPGELLQLKIGDINIETDSSEEGKQYAVLDIGRYGKKSKSRIVGITEFTLQYYLEYIPAEHPDPNNKNAFVFMSKEPSAKYLQKSLPVLIETLRSDYRAFRDKVIPKLLKSPDVPDAGRNISRC
jgi:integrase